MDLKGEMVYIKAIRLCELVKGAILEPGHSSPNPHGQILSGNLSATPSLNVYL